VNFIKKQDKAKLIRMGMTAVALLAVLFLGCEKTLPANVNHICTPGAREYIEVIADPYGMGEPAVMLKCKSNDREVSKFIYTSHQGAQKVHHLLQFQPGSNEKIGERTFNEKPLPPNPELDTNVLLSGQYCGLIDIKYFDKRGKIVSVVINKPCFSDPSDANATAEIPVEQLEKTPELNGVLCVIDIDNIWTCPEGDTCGKIPGQCL